MTAQETVDLRAMAAPDLRRELDETQRALFNLRFQAATRQLADVSQVRQARRRVARIKTLLREHEILVAVGEIDADSPAVAAPVAEPAAKESPAEDEPAAEMDAEETPAAEQPSEDDDATEDDDEDRE